jgi:hypothetical protein
VTEAAEDRRGAALLASLAGPTSAPA